MGNAGKALKQALVTYGISQKRLAAAMGVRHANVSRWVNELRDPSGETILKIRKALQMINPSAAENFIELYLDSADENEEQF